MTKLDRGIYMKRIGTEELRQLQLGILDAVHVWSNKAVFENALYKGRSLRNRHCV